MKANALVGFPGVQATGISIKRDHCDQSCVMQVARNGQATQRGCLSVWGSRKKLFEEPVRCITKSHWRAVDFKGMIGIDIPGSAGNWSCAARSKAERGLPSLAVGSPFTPRRGQTGLEARKSSKYPQRPPRGTLISLIL